MRVVGIKPKITTCICAECGERFDSKNIRWDKKCPSCKSNDIIFDYNTECEKCGTICEVDELFYNIELTDLSLCPDCVKAIKEEYKAKNDGAIAEVQANDNISIKIIGY